MASILPSDYNPFGLISQTVFGINPNQINIMESYAADCRRGRIEKEERDKVVAEKAEQHAKQEAKRVAEVKEKVMNLTEEEKETLKQRYGSHLVPHRSNRHFKVPPGPCFNNPFNRPSGLTEEEADFNVLLKVQEHERRMEAKKAEEEQKAFEAEVQRRVALELYERRVRAEVEERLAQEEKSSKSAILFEELKSLF